MRAKLFLTAALFAVPSMVQSAGDAVLDRATLRGLKTVNIVIDKLDPELGKEGITPGVLQSRLMTKMQAAGIPVNTAASEFVALRITSVRGGRGPYGLSITIAVYQPVVLARDAKARTATQTWEVETILMAEPKQLFRAAMESVDELADRFVTAYRSVNPQ
jgi:hypothetical protein